MITEEFKELTEARNRNDRNSNLGNTVYHMRPNQILRSLHQKTYFKACQTIRMGVPQKSGSLRIGMEELQGEFRDIEKNLNKIKPEKLEIKDIEEIRFNRLRNALTGTINSIDSDGTK